jgi:hypothetical protein
MYLPHSACPHSQPFPANLLGLAFLGASRLEKLLSRFNNILFGSQLLQILFVTMHVSPFVPEYVLSFEIVLPSIEFLWGKKSFGSLAILLCQKDSDIETNRNDYLSKRLINGDPPNTTKAANLVLRFDRHLLLGHLLSQLPPCPPRPFLNRLHIQDLAKLVAQNF